ncbi:hypothetical protein DSO57_1024235 [Entomophthora muscae]|uniref:Uncharacterized protein n=1 Tax=Entomophthora muscae TaxID=34485 RepID=A0ACC2TDT8_9FUNG|nr:hypothetical protein DSO57_1024235 [Entomophthora muscae]
MDELDEHRELMANIQDQLERANSKMASLEQKLDSLPNQHQHRETGHQSQASYWNSSRKEEHHSLDSMEETNQRLPCFIQVLPSMVIIEETVQDLKAQWEEEHKAVSKARFAASKSNHNRPAFPSWQAALVATAPHNTSSFFKLANLPSMTESVMML